MKKKHRKGPFVSSKKQCEKVTQIMKLTLIFLFMFTTGLFATINSQTIRVNIHENNVEVRTILEKIEEQTDFLFIYEKEIDRSSTGIWMPLISPTHSVTRHRLLALPQHYMN